MASSPNKVEKTKRQKKSEKDNLTKIAAKELSKEIQKTGKDWYQSW